MARIPLGCCKCDECGHISAVYERYPSCRDCGIVVCMRCAAPDSLREDDRETEGGESGPAEAYMVETVLCLECAADVEPAPREKDDDDGLGGYSDPRDERDERRGLD